MCTATHSCASSSSELCMVKLIDKKDDLIDAIKAMDKAMVLFYASWCPFSKRFLPVFEKQAKDKASNYLRVMVDEMEDICDKYSIEVYPTVLYFEKGKLSKRLDGISGQGLNEKHLNDFIGECKI